MKMYTSAIALDRFGPDYVSRRRCFATERSAPTASLAGNLYLRGVGDPSLSARFWKDDKPMDALARQIAQAGHQARSRRHRRRRHRVRRHSSIPDGWKTAYLGAAYAARVSALSLNENLVWVVVQPNGKTASVTLEPATTTIPVVNSVRVSGGGGGSIRAVAPA